MGEVFSHPHPAPLPSSPGQKPWTALGPAQELLLLPDASCGGHLPPAPGDGPSRAGEQAAQCVERPHTQRGRSPHCLPLPFACRPQFPPWMPFQRSEGVAERETFTGSFPGSWSSAPPGWEPQSRGGFLGSSAGRACLPPSTHLTAWTCPLRLPTPRPLASWPLLSVGRLNEGRFA